MKDVALAVRQLNERLSKEADRPVVCVVGDGSLLYALQALWSAACYQAAIVYIVLNNGQTKY